MSKSTTGWASQYYHGQQQKKNVCNATICLSASVHCRRIVNKKKKKRLMNDGRKTGKSRRQRATEVAGANRETKGLRARRREQCRQKPSQKERRQ
ncbi:hypothetical protein BCR44DRAFT_1025361 [Catenaria anguillulae PL171]|uniref:Uncharacterized protein n=1 Tax=Catenaria anguillulae PL171 TaxID=765915 RepID=A0A1Y2HT21_9FUNG|nr:hypothetical protein BCR44DRAFT_1025361 [Catenaria anguillulae PL171]